MDPRRELVAMQIANTQAHNAAILAAATAAAVPIVIVDTSNNTSTADENNGNNEINHQFQISNNIVSTYEDIEDVRTASSVISKGILTSSHNTRGLKRINLLAPSSDGTQYNTTTAATDSLQDVQKAPVSLEAVRVVGFCNVIDAWRGRVQAHAVRLMNTRGD